MHKDQQRSLTISYVPIDVLKPYVHNARTHSKHQLRQIADSINAFGFLNPVIRDRTNKIICGHGRLAAAKMLGIKDVPTIQIENLTEDEIRAYVLADNRLAEKAGWDNAVLAIELQHLVTLDSKFDVEITGFSVAEVDLILGGVSNKKDEDEEFSIADVAQPVTTLGDLWLLDKHRLLCGNSLEAASFITLLGTRKADLIFTDPPYNLAIDGNVCGNGSIHHREFPMASGEMSEPEFVAFLTTSFQLLARHSKSGSIHFIFMDFRHVFELLTAGRQVYDRLLNQCVWVKNAPGMGSFYRSQHELVFVFRHGKTRHQNNIQLGQFGRNRSNVWQYNGMNTASRQSDEGNLLKLHPTVKPVSLVADAILDCSSRGEIVLDAFIGSGTTLLAAERVGRVCFGLDLDALYIDTCIRRWQRQTGNFATHAVTGERFNNVAADLEVARG